VQYFHGVLDAAPATRCHTQCFPQIMHILRAIGGRMADIVVCDGFANTDVHYFHQGRETADI
jgi:enamine deaminase RidA (YjgF/YER057c/UK114 family)